MLQLVSANAIASAASIPTMTLAALCRSAQRTVRRNVRVAVRVAVLDEHAEPVAVTVTS